MKSSKFQFDLTNDLIITEENVQAIGERVALGSVRFLMRHSGTMLNRLYWELCEEVFRPHTLQRNLTMPMTLPRKPSAISATILVGLSAR